MTDRPPDRRSAASVTETHAGAGARGLVRFREASAEIADVAILGAADDFQTRSVTVHLGGAITVDVTTTPVVYDRSAAHIARTGSDHYQMAMYLAGGCEYTAGRRAVTARAGDIFVVVHNEPNRSHVLPSDDGSARVLNVLLPRPRLAPLLAAPDAVHGAVISRDSPAGLLLREHMLTLLHPAPDGLVAAETDRRFSELMHLVARRLGPADGAKDEHLARQALLSSIKRYVERSLTTNLDIAHLCRRFAVSRSALYRLFEPEGGIAAYIQQRRLIRAFALLAAPSARDLRIIDIAVDSHFASDATFDRAFRRQFGVSPREVRALAAEKTRTGPSGTRAAGDNLLVRWMREMK